MKSARLSLPLLAALVLYAAGCAAPREVAPIVQGPAAAAENPIRVLMVTATHGYRHAEGIAAAREVMAEMARTTELEVDTTEDLGLLTDQNLARYDVLFFANTTLRDRATGSQGPWEVSVQTENRPIRGRLAVTGNPVRPGGSIRFEIAPESRRLEALEATDSTVAFNFDGGEYGPVSVSAGIEGDRMQGYLVARGDTLPFTGTRAEAPYVTDAQKQAVMNFLRAGKGFVGAHAASDAFYGWDEYREMLGGGLFESHPWTQDVRVVIEEPSNPAVAHFGESFAIRDEIYVLDRNPRWNSRVLASLDMASVGVEEGPADDTRNDYPISWIRRHQGGRVFYTKLGHFGDVWRNPAFQQHLLQGIRMAAGRLEADFTGHRVKETIAENVWPDDLAVDERGNVWIAELRGKVHRYDAATGQTTLVAEVPTTDPTNIEHGLYGIEVDPDFHAGQPYVYLYYAERETFINTLSRFEYRDGRIDLATEQVLLRVPTEPHCCHQAGDLEWGRGGTLLLSTGDTGISSVRPSQKLSEAEIKAFLDRNQLKEAYHWSRLVDSERTGQNLTDLRGKVLRINRDGTIPKDNPFYGRPGVRWEIYAYGLRNPYRIKYDAPTDRVYIGVVGPDEGVTYDWYNVSEKGGENFGWPRVNGRLLYNEWKPEMIPDFVPSMWEYTYEGGGRSATFGPIYRHEGPGAFPAAFQDRVFVFDWARRWIKWAKVEQGEWVSDTTASAKAYPYVARIPTLRLHDIKTFDVIDETRPISIELGPDGALYVAEFDGFWDAGPKARVTRYRWVTGR